jgi:hypothetical protein
MQGDIVDITAEYFFDFFYFIMYDKSCMVWALLSIKYFFLNADFNIKITK